MAEKQAAAPVAKQQIDFTKFNTLAIVSLATALTGFGVIAAIITGHISLAQIKRSGENGRGLAIAGVVIGYVSIGLWIIGGLGMLALRLAYGFSGGMGMYGPGMMGWRD